jgi:hypothetical protein
MELGNGPSVEQLQIASRFESLRKILFSAEYAEHLEKTLAYWALPSDRRLPLALLGRKLRELLAAPFAELSGTPGIGRKKLASLVLLMGRAANTDPAELPADAASPPQQSAAADRGRPVESTRLDPANLSEVTWSQWRASVLRHGLGDEKLGRLAPSLRHMTRVIWNTPLRAYADVTLAELRAMKTHGEKRVGAILEVFQGVHAVVANMGSQPHLVTRIIPRLIDQVEQWVGCVLQRPDAAGAEEIFAHFVGPLLEQVRIDATQQIASLAENRLGITGQITSIRQAARSMGLTRARVYQLLNEISDILAVRWPLGRHQVSQLRDKWDSAASPGKAADWTQFLAAVDLFYPGGGRGVAGPLERALDLAEEDGQLVAAE